MLDMLVSGRVHPNKSQIIPWFFSCRFSKTHTFELFHIAESARGGYFDISYAEVNEFHEGYIMTQQKKGEFCCPVRSMYGIFTYIYLHLQKITSIKCSYCKHMPYMDPLWVRDNDPEKGGELPLQNLHSCFFLSEILELGKIIQFWIKRLSTHFFSFEFWMLAW